MTTISTGSLALPPEQFREKLAFRIILIQSIIAAALSIIFLVWAIISPQNPLFIISGAFAFVSIASLILRYQFSGLNKYPFIDFQYACSACIDFALSMFSRCIDPSRNFVFPLFLPARFRLNDRVVFRY